MKKKFFNLAVIFATLVSGAAFTSCDKDDDDDNKNQDELKDEPEDEDIIIDNFEDEDNGDVMIESGDVTVVMGQKYAAYNPSIDGGTLNFIVLEVSGTAGSKVVKFQVELKGDVADGQTFEIGDDADHASYFGRIDGKLTTCKQSVAAKVENAKNIIFALSSSADDYLITSATVNNKVAEAGAKTTRFATYINKK